MSEAYPNAFIHLPSRAHVFHALDECVQHDRKKTAFMTSVSGAGRTAILEAWVKQDDRPSPVIMIELIPPPSSSVPMMCVSFSLIWAQLLQLYHAAEGLSTTLTPRRPSIDQPESWFTVRQALNLFHHRVVPMLDTLQIAGIVIDNASLLDEPAFAWLLQMQSPSDPRQRRTIRRGLIFGTRLRSEPSDNHRFVKMVQDRPALRQPWHERLKLDRLNLLEFFTMWSRAMEDNLRARFDEEIGKDERNQVIAGYYAQTGGSWWGIEALITTYHEELGPFRSRPYRTITHDIIRRVQERLGKTQWTVVDDDQEPEKRKRNNREKA